ncbi:MAG: hypothetical protein NTY47_05175, partial [Candidatus Omnitrophica bacterium]|nr:hypothetical protein [Candidatus Omnitrophota bacterium]
NIEKARRAEAYSTMRSIREAVLGYYAANALYPSSFPITVTIDGDAVMKVAQSSSRSFTFTYDSTTVTSTPGPGSCTYTMGVSNGTVAVSGGGTCAA